MNHDKVNVRYIVHNVDEAIEFYTSKLGFTVDLHPAPGFARLSRGNLNLLLNAGTGQGGAAQATDSGKPEPGGWNRVQFLVGDLESTVKKLKQANCHFRSDIIQGQGGKQVLLDDPSGNPVELFQGT